jgi:outer membrane cobalamin receptor
MTTEGGRSSVSELAGGAQLHRGPIRADAAVGVAIPIGAGDAPWPEAKLSVTYAPVAAMSVKAIAARKGRLPTLRERYRVDIGNESLDPEIATFGELEVTLRPSSWVTASVAGWARDTDGMIRFDGDRAVLINVEQLAVRGVDVRVTIADGRRVHGGGAWSFSDAHSPLLGSAPLDFLPTHRGELWVAGSIAGGHGGRVRLRYVGEQIDRQETLDDYATLDLSGYARVTRTLRGTLRVDNIADARFPVRHGVASPGRVVIFALEGVWE